jgi:allantoicase
MATDNYDDAYSAARRYCREVQDSLRSSIRDDLADFADVDAMNDRLHEEADNHQAVIYTGRDSCYCFGSSNEDAYQEETGEPAPSVEVRAMFAIMADVRECSEWESMTAAVEEGTVAEYLADAGSTA